ncbi:MAG: chemotaxis-specific protein-glutamate methyltransferase CheB [Deltaproteobacteria bacterium]|nr:chemotaxis-specific protein-glutamate methyltransferase CheB [Deltaproteobacteria bacterium]
MINVLIVEDSQVVQQFIEQVLGSDPAIRVAGVASNGEEALAMLQFRKPDVITMDAHMPKMDGFETTRRIMESYPVPIVIVSASWYPHEVEKTFQAMQAGAVAVVEKPVGVGHPNHAAMAKKLTEIVKLMAEVKVVRRTRSRQPVSAIPSPPLLTEHATGPVNVVAIGASTGGPPVLLTILSLLSKDFLAPLLIVQHIAENFLSGMADWLTKETSVPVHVATRAERPLPRHAYLAPDGYQMGVTPDGSIGLVDAAPEHNARPSVSYLFRSVARVFGKTAIGVLLTGMGKDGARELKEMKNRGALTIAQDRDTAVVHGMPGEAIGLGGATLVLPPESIAAVLNQISDAEKRGRP